jgi:hypothetical protein
MPSTRISHGIVPYILAVLGVSWYKCGIIYLFTSGYGTNQIGISAAKCPCDNINMRFSATWIEDKEAKTHTTYIQKHMKTISTLWWENLHDECVMQLRLIDFYTSCLVWGSKLKANNKCGFGTWEKKHSTFHGSSSSHIFHYFQRVPH